MKFIFTLLVVAAIAQNEANQLDHLFTVGNNIFTAKMFSEVVKSNPDKSVILSAFSVLTPLAQLSLASEGASHDELLQAIGFPDDNATRTVFSHLNKKLQTIESVELKIANKIYVDGKYELNPEFSAVTKDVFHSEVENVNFNMSAETAKKINSWVQNQTNNGIKDLVSTDDLGPDIRTVLVNAIYFKGEWNIPFDKEMTTKGDFHVSKDKTIKVPMMFKRAKLKYVDSVELNARLLELPYSRNKTSFMVILPKKVDGLATLIEKLKDPSAMKLVTSKRYAYDVNVFLPKFKIETKTDLKDVLGKMDVKRIFDPQQAQLSRFLKDNGHLYVSKAIQKAYIEVTEKGAEAGAANHVSAVGLSLGEEVTFQVDHSFVFFLKEGDIILFVGVYSPEEEK